MTQKGSLVSPERLRFDFSHNKPIEKDEMIKINKTVNEMVKGASEVQTRIMTPKEAVNLGALALFGETTDSWASIKHLILSSSK